MSSTHTSRLILLTSTITTALLAFGIVSTPLIMSTTISGGGAIFSTASLLNLNQAMATTEGEEEGREAEETTPPETTPPETDTDAETEDAETEDAETEDAQQTPTPGISPPGALAPRIAPPQTLGLTPTPTPGLTGLDPFLQQLCQNQPNLPECQPL